MRYLLVLSFLLISCQSEKGKKIFVPITSVEVQSIFKDSSSIRAIDVKRDGVSFAGSNGRYGFIHFKEEANKVAQIASINSGKIDFLDKNPSFRAVAATQSYIYILSIEQPALLYQYDKKRSALKLVYIEDVEGVFYDSMHFFDDQEGIAMGDPINGCLSILKTNDGGESWLKIPCEKLPAVYDGEAAFAASDTNIEIVENTVWIITGGKKSRVFKSTNRGDNWNVYDTPLIQGEETTGAYTMDFLNGSEGIIYGGDYLKPEFKEGNIAITNDGGLSWRIVASGANQGYKSCVQYFPGSNGKELLALGFTGISYSKDSGKTWQEISDQSFLSFRFLNDSIAFAGNREGVSRLDFKRN